MLFPEKIGVILVNLGTPINTDFFSVRRYLSQFLSDKRIIETPRWIWYFILYGVILNIRPRSLSKKYKKIWNNVENASPLRVYTKNLSFKLNQIFKDQNLIIKWSMRYGTPSIEETLEELLSQNCEHILLFPLYPQYSATTTASVYDAFFTSLKKKRNIPKLSTISSHSNHPFYIETLSKTIYQHFQKIGYIPEHLMVTFHGIPKSYIEKGDIYLQECEKTFQALQKNLNFPKEKMSLTFQSRFGPAQWLQPYTNGSIKKLAKEGIQSLAVISPGFSSDCLETIDEIDCEAAEIFYKNGGKKFSYVPCLNDSQFAIELYEKLIKERLQGPYS